MFGRTSGRLANEGISGGLIMEIAQCGSLAEFGQYLTRLSDKFSGELQARLLN